MKKIILIAVAILLINNTILNAQQLPKESPEAKTQRLKWWTDARFGMFIH